LRDLVNGVAKTQAAVAEPEKDHFAHVGDGPTHS
jgi:hypothetical protein